MPIRKIVCLGLSHRTAQVELRERLNCKLADLHGLLPLNAGRARAKAANRFRSIGELSLLSTCNRVETYACVDTNEPDARALLVDFLAEANDQEPAAFDGHLYCYEGKDAASHLCRVAAGLDSLVLGEPQILGQVTDAYSAAVDRGSVGPMLSLLYRAAIRSGKRARNETAINSNPASISSVAISLAEERVGDLTNRRILVVGLGEMGLLTLKALRARGITNISVVNRTRERAENVASESGYHAYSLAELPIALSATDVAISTTSSPHTIIEAADLRDSFHGRGDQQLILIDISVPRDIDPAVRDLPNLQLFDIDDLRTQVDTALSARKREIPRVEAIINQEIEALEDKLKELTIKPVITDLRRKAESIRQQELERTLRHLPGIDPQSVVHIQRFSRSLLNKLLHEPTARLKESANQGQTDEYASMVRELFGLKGSDEG